MGRVPHIVALPYPAQGHVIPMLELMQTLATTHNFKITFVNTDSIHKRFINALSKDDNVRNIINFVSITDGLEPWEDRNDFGKLTDAIWTVMPGKLEELIQEINQSDDENVTCVVVDGNLGWGVRVAEKMGINRAVFWPAATAMLALMLDIEKMMDDGIIDNQGSPTKEQMIQLLPAMPTISTQNLAWTCLGSFKTQEIIFPYMLENNKILREIDNFSLCNTCHELEAPAISLIPKMLPIGPLLASNRLGKSTGNFWTEDTTCLEWLDQQLENSVVYVAFGSFTIFENSQFKELALGLELMNRPFLWVVRPDITSDMDVAYPKGFKERVANRGKMVGWAPQQMVLSHPSIACFVTHCGWNSTMEGLSNGVPFLCWPYFADQFLNQSYICDIWKVGLGFERDEKGIVGKEEFKGKVDNLLKEERFKERALKMKKIGANSVKEGGLSHKNLQDFILWIKK